MSRRSSRPILLLYSLERSGAVAVLLARHPSTDTGTANACLACGGAGGGRRDAAVSCAVCSSSVDLLSRSGGKFERMNENECRFGGRLPHRLWHRTLPLHVFFAACVRAGEGPWVRWS